MSVAAFPKRRQAPGFHALPIVAYFPEDSVAARFFHDVQRFRRLPFEASVADTSDVERIVLVGSEQLVERHYSHLRLPNVRVLALSDRKFNDPRNDGAVYAYVPPTVADDLLERLVDNALDHIHLLQTRQQVNERLVDASDEIHELNKIGIALSSEHDPDRLLELILTKSREFTASDAGSLYLIENIEAPNERQSLLFGPAQAEAGVGVQPEALQQRLRFKLAQNDSVAVAFREITMEVNENSIAGYVALTGEIVNIADAYDLPAGVPYSINRAFDEESGYRTRSILAVPIRNQKDRIVGVLQLLNAKRVLSARLDSLDTVDAQVIPFTPHQQEIVLSLASQAAVAFENTRLYDSIQRLFEGFVRASVTAIETRDPATSGHSFRVANLTVALAEAVDRADCGPYAPVRFTRDHMREIRYASLLHDFGKVGVPEEVLVKARKLYPSQLELIQQRFGFVRRTLENEILQAKVKYLLEKSREEFLEQEPLFDRKLAGALRELDEHMKAILVANEPTVLPEGDFARLRDIAEVQYLDPSGQNKPLLTPEEVKLLSIRQGSLDDDERLKIEAHVLHTVTFLQAIPWTSELRNVPEIARAHHEKLNGTGYPYKLSASEIPLQTRMMTIADIFDALAAADRPYKKAVSVERALEILHLAVQDGEIDAALFDVFKQAEIYRQWKVEAASY